MESVSQVDPKVFGQEVANGTTVRLLQSSLSKSETNVSGVWKIFRNLDKDNAWMRFRFPDEDGAKLYIYSASDFRRFIESPWPNGCNTSIDLLRRMVRDTPAWPAFERLIRGEPGNPTGANQHSAGNSDNVTDSSDAKDPATVPVSKKQAPTGNSVNYAMSRLEKKKPELYADVVAGKISPNAAMVQAGFRKKSMTVPAIPADAARVLARNFTGDQLGELIDELQKLLDDQLDAV